MTETNKSLKEVFKDRLSSPLYGAFILSWIACNWKIFYLTFFVNSDEIEGTKIDFIVNNYSQLKYLVIFPAFTTFFIIALLPIFNNIVYFLNAHYKKWRKNTAYKIDETIVLTFEESIELRENLRKQSEKYHNVIQGKNETIDSLIKSDRKNLDEIARLEMLVNDLTKQMLNLKKVSDKWHTNDAEKLKLINDYKNQISDLLEKKQDFD